MFPGLAKRWILFDSADICVRLFEFIQIYHESIKDINPIISSVLLKMKVRSLSLHPSLAIS